MNASHRLTVAAAQALLIAALVAAALLLAGSTAGAEHDKFRYKFPCRPYDTCILTQGVHGTGYDFVIMPPPAFQAEVQAVSEGTFRGYDFSALVCTWDSTPGVPNSGIFALVEDIHGRTVRYAHLKEFGSLQEGDTVLQGDVIGIQGNTGNAEDCGDHLHLGGVAGTADVGYMDGVPTSDLVTAHPHLEFDSTNSVVGAANAPGVAIRDEFTELGSWSQVGWTADSTGGNVGCGSYFPCRLFVHYDPDPVEGHWGSRQDFRLHPASGFEYGSIQAGRWAVNEAYLIKPAYFDAWLGDGLVLPDPPRREAIGLPIMDRIGNSPPVDCVQEDCCRASAGCISYQRFNVGFIWANTQLEIKTTFCPDLNLNYTVGFTDILLLTQHAYHADTGQPYEPWDDAFLDVKGDGGIGFNDFLLVSGAMGTPCFAY